MRTGRKPDGAFDSRRRNTEWPGENCGTGDATFGVSGLYLHIEDVMTVPFLPVFFRGSERPGESPDGKREKSGAAAGGKEGG